MSRERGRRKLMLRLPDIRHLLAGMSSEALGEMFEAYDLAVDALDRFRNQSPREDKLISEYEQLCREIEQEVVVYCKDQ
ncbi:hypothetical protein AM571_CH03645 [Rhizobium etli 8C-3]|uniref:Rop-like protein n=2 Tax=Rhizobium TaxID=379 RepID=A0A4V2VDA2_9HYPH|nr:MULTISPECIES: hypothetical protein [Rhizobium]APO76436.1 hypothetical protein AM571_CH03645 [Rhizobium etli 8C-3]TCU17843.1 hypothetical protein EV130_11540 [Rhizobium azibense]TCU31945.1 hypothetical protein EV129_12339 [Rhizobium azibense]